MEENIKKIMDFLDKTKWRYTLAKDGNAILTDIDMQNAIGVLKIFISFEKNNYVVYALLDNTVDKEKYCAVSEYLHRANHGLLNGNFEFDYDKGKVAYKTFVNTNNIELSDKVILESLYIPVWMFAQYGENLLKLMLEDGYLPKKLIEEAES